MRKQRTTAKIYTPKSLLDGARIGQTPGSLWVGVPDKFSGTPIVVIYGGTEMKIDDWRTEAVSYRTFKDKFWNENSKRPQYYTLGYFRFQPNM